MPRPTQGSRKAKVAQVLREYKAGELHSGSGQKVTNPKQAVAIGLSESGQAKPKRTRRPSRPLQVKHVTVVQRS